MFTKDQHLVLSENNAFFSESEALDATKPYKPELTGQEWSRSLQLAHGFIYGFLTFFVMSNYVVSNKLYLQLAHGVLFWFIILFKITL